MANYYHVRKYAEPYGEGELVLVEESVFDHRPDGIKEREPIMLGVARMGYWVTKVDAITEEEYLEWVKEFDTITDEEYLEDLEEV